jgi:hypothetical protein
MSNRLVQVSEWFSFSHWGMVRLAVLVAPEWFVDGMSVEDDQLDWA